MSSHVSSADLARCLRLRCCSIPAHLPVFRLERHTPERCAGYGHAAISRFYGHHDHQRERKCWRFAVQPDRLEPEPCVAVPDCRWHLQHRHSTSRGDLHRADSSSAINPARRRRTCRWDARRSSRRSADMASVATWEAVPARSARWRIWWAMASLPSSIPSGEGLTLLAAALSRWRRGSAFVGASAPRRRAEFAHQRRLVQCHRLVQKMRWILVRIEAKRSNSDYCEHWQRRVEPKTRILYQKSEIPH